MELNLYEFFTAFFVGLFSCYALDKLSLVIYNRFKKPEITDSSQNIRYFFIHFVVNLYVTVACIPDIVACILDIGECATNEWLNGYWPYGVAVSLHIYHIIAFKLTQMDWIHHGVTVIIGTPVLLICTRTCLAVTALWFMSGFPGAIDYCLLWLVKLGYVKAEFERSAYVAISVWLRAPGCISACALQLGMIKYVHEMSVQDIIGGLWNMLIVYWNGLFFMQHTLANYYKKI